MNVSSATPAVRATPAPVAAPVRPKDADGDNDGTKATAPAPPPVAKNGRVDTYA